MGSCNDRRGRRTIKPIIMTVTEIVQDLLKYNMITAEAAVVLLTAQAEANIKISNAKETACAQYWYSTTTK